MLNLGSGLTSSHPELFPEIIWNVLQSDSSNEATNYITPYYSSYEVSHMAYHYSFLCLPTETVQEEDKPAGASEGDDEQGESFLICFLGSSGLYTQ